MIKRKTLIIGLDCAEPDLVFNKFTKLLPNISALVSSGLSARMESCDPPITIPAWSSMFSGYSPGDLGVYGFRNRDNYSYNKRAIANSSWIHKKRIWDYIGDADGTSIVLGVPQTYPVRPISGYLVSGLLTPSIKSECTYPRSFKNKLQQIAPDYLFDVKDFRNQDPELLLKQIYKMTAHRFQLAKFMLKNYKWDLFVLVEIGLDRIQHAFWQFMDSMSIGYEKDHKYENVIKKYYIYLDYEIGELLKLIPVNTDIYIVSDHGAKALKGLFRINQWLIKEGLLVLRKELTSPQEFDYRLVDWSKSKAWADGGYYARIYFNIKDREEQGIVTHNEIAALITSIKNSLGKIDLSNDLEINNDIFTARELYNNPQGIPPDLIVYFNDLSLRASAAIGGDNLFTTHNDTGPDGANHAKNGIFILNGLGIKNQIRDKISILDVAPMALRRMGIKKPGNLPGSLIF